MHKKKKILKWAMLIIWASFIFFMSNMPGDVSSEQSDVVVKVIHDLGIDVNGLFGITITFIVRKIAHFSEYFILYLLIYMVTCLYVNEKKARVLTILFVFIYAVSDEIHQIFVPGREAAFRDVMIDTSGGFLAFVILSIIYKIKNKRKALRNN